MTFEQDLASLADIVKRARPDWGHGPITSRLKALAPTVSTAGRALDVALRAAADPDAKSPDAITWDRYRQVPAAEAGFGPRCGIHGTEPAASCRSCAADAKAETPEAAEARLAASLASGGTGGPGWRERLREAPSRAAEGMPEDAGQLQGGAV